MLLLGNNRDTIGSSNVVLIDRRVSSRQLSMGVKTRADTVLYPPIICLLFDANEPFQS